MPRRFGGWLSRAQLQVEVVHYLEFGGYCRIAGEVLGLDPRQIAELPNIGLADSALAAPRAGFGDYEAYPNLLEKAVVLVERLARNTRCQTATSAPPSCLSTASSPPMGSHFLAPIRTPTCR